MQRRSRWGAMQSGCVLALLLLGAFACRWFLLAALTAH